MNFLEFTDGKDDKLQLGDRVNVIKGKHKGTATYVFMFCIPQHRFGFLHERIFNQMVTNNEQELYDSNVFPEPFVIDTPNLDFYWTPRSKNEIVRCK